MDESKQRSPTYGESSNPKTDITPNGTSRKRKRHSPSRYGAFGALDLSSSLEDAFINADDSMEDKTYELPPESPRKVVLTIKKVPHKAKKSKTNGSIEQNSQANNQDSDQFAFESYDDEFDSINSYEPVTKSSSSSSLEKPSEINGVEAESVVNFNATDSDATELIDVDKHDSQMIGNKPIDSAGAKTVTESTNFHVKVPSGNEPSHDMRELCQIMLAEFREFSKETRARFSIIEEAMLKGGVLGQTNNKSRIVKNIEEIRLFEVSNHLPIKINNDLELFEGNLKNEIFRKAAVCCCVQGQLISSCIVF